MLGTSVLLGIMAFALFGFIAREVVKWGTKEQAGLVERRRTAASLSAEFKNVGLAKVAEFLECYSVGDLGGMYDRIHELALVVKASGKDAILKDAEGIFKTVLNSKLNTSEGRAWISALLIEATPKVASAALEKQIVQ